MKYIEIEHRPNRVQLIAVRNCNTAKYTHNMTKRRLRQEVIQHLKAIWRCYLMAKRARLDYKLSK
jgi:hypothetical protein